MWIIHCGGVAADGMSSQMLISWNVHLPTKSLHMSAMYTYFYCNFWVTFGVQIFTCISDNFLNFVKQIIHLTLQQRQHVLVKMTFKNTPIKNFLEVKLRKRLRQICLAGIIYRAKLSVSSTTTGFIWLCVSSTSADTASLLTEHMAMDSSS